LPGGRFAICGAITPGVFYKNGELLNFDTQMNRKLDAVLVLMDG